jgi:UDP-glucose 4-epimerase
MIHLITGGAGCIGSELAGALLAKGETVRVLDNLSSGRKQHIAAYKSNPRFKFIFGDLSSIWSVQGADMVWHLTAKTNIKNLDPEHYDFQADYDQNLQATWRLLRVMRQCGVKRLAFASSAAVYGEATVISEDLIPAPVSMYGATKLSCEAIIRALALRAGIQSWIFRYCSIVSGKARTSGNMVIPDLMHKLKRDPTRLEILGDGNQTKPSLHVSECVEAMQFVVDNCKEQVSIHNIGASDAISVTRQAEIICEMMGVSPKFEYTGGAGGWPGDVPSFRMNVEKLAALGWRAKRTSEEAVRLAIKGLLESGE